MIIAVDFDNTLIDTLNTSRKYLDEFKPGNTLGSYRDLPDDERREFFKIYNPRITKEAALFKGVKKTFNFCKKSGIKLVMVSARGLNYEPIIKATYEFIKEKNLEFDEVYLGVEDKGKLCHKLGVSLLIDDKDSELKKVEDYGIRVLKYGCKSDKFDYALSWDDVLKFIQKGLNNDKNSR